MTLPTSLADACLVRMSQIEPDTQVLAIDSHFRINRRHGNEPLMLITRDSSVRSI